MDEVGSEPTILLLRLLEVFVYKLPPLKGNAGRRAEEWDLANPAITGSLSVVNRGETVYVQIFKDETTLFASAPIKVDEKRPLEFFLEGCKDTSRYFALRIEDERSKRHTYIGIGFRDRQSAFDLRAALDDQIRRISRQHEVPESSSSDDLSKSTEQLLDLSLKDGEKIAVKINLPPKRKKKTKKTGQLSLSKPPSAATGIKPLTKPLTSSTKAPSLSQPATTTQTVTLETNKDEDDDDWGDFQS
mmetsp:Transcript_12932/g.15679  ORF Transcript_12932/g.15679 Transcript_12932/m.15679 type:complete len:245 (-) Transcript_12932:102-836(-)|eukprot:CAMPEP_0184020162 /NCGR_PEP_ID=MMETSP0954-20121128/9190_1 /TAXON_ID=627963 /ORGANISM="Aplanochytrium sp, Strain PBS07" /LENGTH=244 /DNA_ID=CAMNT_0026301981 /DNA_START=136 /DNA_END=870 /DNA_ORIENTATION=+